MMTSQLALPTKALSVRQPWAWAIIHAGKDIENRTVHSVSLGGMRPGRICIHASKGMTLDEYEYTRDFMAVMGIACPRPDALIRGAIIGVVTVTEVVQEHKSDWFFGPRGLVLADAEACDPIPASGALGYFNWASGGAVENPLPWMLAWPDATRRQRRERKPVPLPLFDDGGSDG